MTTDFARHRPFSEAPLKDLRRGAVFLYPTDTVWGLGCCIDQPEAIERVFTIKDRPSHKTVPVLLHPTHLLDLVEVRSPEQKAMERFWPGPLTLILPARDPASLDGHLVNEGTLALRDPDHGPLRDLLRTIGPIVGTSANRTGHAPASDRSELNPELLEQVDWVIGEGRSGGSSSTVAQWHPERSSWEIHRSGPIGSEDLNRCR